MPVWYGLMAPAGTPREAIALLNKEIERVLKEPDIRERFTTLGVAPTGGSADAFGAFLECRGGEVHQARRRDRHEGRMRVK